MKNFSPALEMPKQKAGKGQKVRFIAMLVVTTFYTLMTLFADYDKIAVTAHLRESFAGLGIIPYSPALGVIHFVFLALFLYPRTMRLGFILTSCYLAGAMGVHISHQSDPSPAIINLMAVWIATWLRDPSVFSFAPIPLLIPYKPTKP